MNAEQKIKHEILLNAIKRHDLPENITSDNIGEIYKEVLVDSGEHYDCENEFRQEGVRTGIQCESSRHYDSESVAKKMRDGSWVGWTFWSGGGKHGEPEAIGWMAEAYFLDVKEKMKMIPVEFTKI